MSCLNVLGSSFEKLLSYLKSASSNYLIVKFDAKIKSLHLGPKILYLAISGMEFEEGIAIFQINTLKFFLKQSFTQ